MLCTAAFWKDWYAGIFQVPEFASPFRFRFILFCLPFVVLFTLWYLLRTQASHDVQDSGPYLFLYVVVGVGWLGMMQRFISLMGVSARDDVIGKRNGAAAWALSGALAGCTFAFFGGNVGDGPGVEVVLFCAGLASGGFFAQWFVLEVMARHQPSESVTIVRDLGAGIRLGGFLAAIGLILGWSVAGDWTSVSGTFSDFAISAWPSLILTLVAILVESLYSPRSKTTVPHFLMSLAFGVAYLTLAVQHVMRQGLWE